MPLHLKQIFPPIMWTFTEGEGGGIKSRLPFKIFSTFSTRWFVLGFDSSSKIDAMDLTLTHSRRLWRQRLITAKLSELKAFPNVFLVTFFFFGPVHMFETRLEIGIGNIPHLSLVASHSWLMRNFVFITCGFATM